MLACAALLCPRTEAQQAATPDPPPLEAVLDRLEANYVEYAHTVPNLFCDEVVRSAYNPVASFGKPVQVVTDSTFRLQRALSPDHRLTLKESRDVKRVDGKPVAATALAGPSLLYGVFGSALRLVSTREARCMKFKLHPHLSRTQPARIVIDFSPLPRRSRDPACGPNQPEGRAFVDPDTLRLRRIEVRNAPYDILPNVPGEWDWSADYDPILFDGKPFWLPRTIASTATPFTRGTVAWTFTAQYSACHQLAVKSTILPTLTPDSAAGSPPARSP